MSQDDNKWLATMIPSTVILNAVKNLSVNTNSHPLGDLEILRFTQDGSQCIEMLILVYVILNAVKNLEVSKDAQPLSDLEILRFTQDDTQECPRKRP